MDALKEKLDGSFGDGPPPPPVASHLAAGRRALKRRRVTTGAVALTAVAVLGTTWFAASPGTPTESRNVAGPPTSAAPPSPKPWTHGELVRYVDGELEIRQGVTVHQRITNPYGYELPSLSDALDVTWKGARQWLMITDRPAPEGDSYSSSAPSNGWASFADYVADQVDVDGPDGWPETFRLNEQGKVVATAGTQVFNRTDDPQLGPDFAAPGEATGAAVVSVEGETGNYFVVWRVTEGELDVITTPPTFTVGATFQELLSQARAQYASGEGLR